MWPWEKRDGNRMLIIDEKKIESTHHPDGTKHDVSSLHKFIKEILKPSTATATATATATTVEAKTGKIGSPAQMGGQGQVEVDGDDFANSLVKRYKELKEDFFGPDSQSKPDFRNISESSFKELDKIVPEISIELWYKSSGGGDVNKTTIEVFKILSRYSWKVKIIVTLAAFALIYKDSSSRVKNTEPIRDLIDAMVQLTNTIVDVDVDDTRLGNISTHIQTAVSWTIGSIVACTSQIRYFEDELSILTEKVVEMNNRIGRLHAWHQKVRSAGDYRRNSTQKKDDQNIEILKDAQKKMESRDSRPPVLRSKI